MDRKRKNETPEFGLLTKRIGVTVPEDAVRIKTLEHEKNVRDATIADLGITIQELKNQLDEYKENIDKCAREKTACSEEIQQCKRDKGRFEEDLRIVTEARARFETMNIIGNSALRHQKEEIDKLNAIASDLTATILTKNTEIERVTFIIRSLEGTIAAKDTEIQNLNRYVASKDLELQTLNQNIAIREAEFQSQQIDYKLKSSEIISLREEIERVTVERNDCLRIKELQNTALQALRSEYTNYVGSVEAKETDLSALTKKLQTAELKISELESLLTPAQRQLQEFGVQIRTLTQQLGELNGTIASMQERNNKLTSTITSTNTVVQSLTDQLKEKQDQLNGLKKQCQEDIRSLTNQLSSYNTSMKVVTEEKDICEKQLSSYLKLISNLQNEIKGLKVVNNTGMEIEDLTTKIQSTEKKADSLVRKIEDLEKINLTSQETIKLLKKSLLDLGSNASILEEFSATIEKKLTECDALVASKEYEIAELKAQQRSLQQTLEDLNKKLLTSQEELKSKGGTSQDEIIDLNSKTRDLVEERSKIQKKLTDCTFNLSVISNDLTTKTSLLSKRQVELNTCRDELNKQVAKSINTRINWLLLFLVFVGMSLSLWILLITYKYSSIPEDKLYISSEELQCYEDVATYNNRVFYSYVVVIVCFTFLWITMFLNPSAFKTHIFFLLVIIISLAFATYSSYMSVRYDKDKCLKDSNTRVNGLFYLQLSISAFLICFTFVIIVYVSRMMTKH